MADVNLRMVMLKDLLHAAGLPPLTSHDNTENGETNTFSVENQAQTPKLGLVGRTWSEAHEALPESVHRTAADKVSSAVRDGTIIWNEPIEYARAMKITLENRNARPVPNRKGPLDQVTSHPSQLPSLSWLSMIAFRSLVARRSPWVGRSRLQCWSQHSRFDHLACIQ